MSGAGSRRSFPSTGHAVPPWRTVSSPLWTDWASADLVAARGRSQGGPSGPPLTSRGLLDRHRHHAVGIFDRAVEVGAALLDRVHDLHAGNDMADDRVFAVQELARRVHDEELRVGAVRIGGTRHADDTALERKVREFGRDVRK